MVESGDETIGAAAGEQREPYPSGQGSAQIQRVSGLVAISLLSPIAGMCVDVMLASRFGTTPAIDAFRITYLVFGFGTQLLVNQMLPNVLIPTLAEFRAAGKESNAWEVAWAVGIIYALVCGIAALLGMRFSDGLIRILGPGLTGQARLDGARLIQYCGWALIPTVWTGVCTGLLNVYRIFYIPTLAQLLTNLFLILGVAISGRSWSSHTIGLAILAGASGTVPLQLFYIWRIRRRLGLPPVRFDVPLHVWRTALRTSVRGLPLVLMVAGGQLGNIVANRELSLLGTGLVSTFNYAWRLQQIVSLAPWCLGIVAFPALSEEAARNSSRFPELSFGVLRAAALLAGPLTALLFFVREPLLNLLFYHGAMSHAAVAQTCNIFGILLILTLAGSLIPAAQKILFALKNTVCPSIAMLVCQVAFLPAVPWAAHHFGLSGIVWVLAAGYWLIPASMLVYLQLRYRLISRAGIGTAPAWLLLVVAAAGSCAWLAVRVVGAWSASPFRSLVQVVAGSLAAGVASYLVAQTASFPEAQMLRRCVSESWTRLLLQSTARFAGREA